MSFENTRLYLAPMEGVGGYTYRNAQAEIFTRADKYFSPFVSPYQRIRLHSREMRDVLPENNRNIPLIPQVLTNEADQFIMIADILKDLGYDEINLNLGCPSNVVVKKGRGAGFLAHPEELDRFLDKIFTDSKVRISIKTRIGVDHPGEFEKLLEIFNRYPMEELIIHPRLRTDFYRNKPNMECFSWALSHSKNPVVYNGDIFFANDFKKFNAEFPRVNAVMIGRGVLINPCLFGEIRNVQFPEKDTLKKFHDKICADYSARNLGEKQLLCKMKELWVYMIHSFTNCEKHAKKINKAQKWSDYQAAVNSLFEEEEISTGA